MDETPAKRRPSISQLSKTPSWVMLGFLFGAAFVWALPKKAPPARPVVVSNPERQVIVKTPRPLMLIESVFEQWHELATWDQNVTQVAMWSSEDGSFSDFYEVRRVDGGFYFRSIPQLTNRPIRHGKPVPPECPLQFTETEAQYQEWREQGRFERPAERSTVPPRVLQTTPDAEPILVQPEVEVPKSETPRRP